MKNLKSKKEQQLGMNPSTASGKLVRDIMFKLAVKLGENYCYQCGLEIKRDNFSIEHKIPWLDSENPKELYFDLENIAFSHGSCNSAAARRDKKPYICGTVRSYKHGGCRCSECRRVGTAHKRSQYTTERRQAQYQRTGK